MAAAEPHIPIACARRSIGNAFTTSASDAGTNSAAPNVWITRPTMRTLTDPAAPQMAEDSVKITMPVTNVRRRPMRSAKRPQTIRKAAKITL